MRTIPFVSFDFHARWRTEMTQAMVRVLDSKWYVLGGELQGFQRSYAELTGVKHCEGVANGLDALTICLRVLGVGPGDEVLVPSNTYIATWLAVSAVGATPVPVEPDAKTYNLAPDRIEAGITSRTRVILPVHLYGQACDMSGIMAIAGNHGLYVVEDNAQAHLAEWQGQMTGSFGHVNATSFYPTKNLGALGDAGAVTTDSDDLARDVRLHRNYGSEVRYHNVLKGANSRLDELQAAVLNVKLKYLKAVTQERQNLAMEYFARLRECHEVTLPLTAEGASHVYHLFVIRCDERGELQKHLHSNGVETLIHYPLPPHLQEAYSDGGFRHGQYPVAESIASSCLSLPLYPGMTADQIATVCDLIVSFYK